MQTACSTVARYQALHLPSTDPGRLDWQYNEAYAFFRSGMHKAAEEALRTLLTTVQESPEPDTKKIKGPSRKLLKKVRSARARYEDGTAFSS